MSQSPKLRLVRPPSDGEPPDQHPTLEGTPWHIRMNRELTGFFRALLKGTYSPEKELPKDEIIATIAEYKVQAKDLLRSAFAANSLETRIDLLDQILRKKFPLIMRNKNLARQMRGYFAQRLGLVPEIG